MRDANRFARGRVGKDMRAQAWGAALAAVIVVGCTQPAPDKDVAAVVAGETVTITELEREMALAGVRRPNDPAVRRAALDEIVVRKLLAKSARAQSLDKSPAALELRRRADETFDANLDRIATIEAVPNPTPAEVKAYVAARPDMFERRTGYLIDQLMVLQPPTNQVFADLKPTKTLEEAEAVLKRHEMLFRRVIVPMDSLRSNPTLAATVAKLPRGEPFIIPGAGAFTVNRVREAQLKPVTGQQAEAIARQMIRAERMTKALRDRLTTLHREQVVYGPAFARKTPPAK